MKLPVQKGKEVIFENIEPQQEFSLENQDRKLINITDKDIINYLEDMFDSYNEFVILTSPKVQNKIRYIQSCLHDDGIEVEIAIEEEGTRLFYKMCSEEECCSIFLDFFYNRFVPKMDEYKPVEFL